MSNESENKNDKIIDRDKYKGHTESDTWRIVGDNFVMNGESPSSRFIAYVKPTNEGEPIVMGFSDADANLLADAPLILQAYEEKCKEVKRLRLLFRELINDMNADDYIEWCNKIGCPDGLEVYAMTGDE